MPNVSVLLVFQVSRNEIKKQKISFIKLTQTNQTESTTIICSPGIRP